ncbi:MAG: hypothetical protein ACXW3D_05105 [Caulobacteraceae bacterium]
MPSLFGAPVEFFLFAAILIGVAVAHKRALTIAAGGFAILLLYKLVFSGVAGTPGIAGLAGHFAHEWVILAELLLLLLGFSALASQFESSNLPELAPRILPDNRFGPLALLALVFCMSAVLDNIAACVIGGVIARHVFKGQVGIGFLVALVAAANAGGAGSVLGDTTTTLLWIGGVSPVAVLPAFIAAAIAFIVFAIPAGFRQVRLAPIVPHAPEGVTVDWPRVIIVGVIVGSIVAGNVFSSLYAPHLHDEIPVIGLAIWTAILLTMFWRAPDWKMVGEGLPGALFLVALVASASLMPVEHLPDPSWAVTLGIGFLSAVFDNIPLTALALKQNGQDWPLLAYAVGFGGSMLWFGSSAGVALSNIYPEIRSTWAWLRNGWYVIPAYVAGFLVLLWVKGWDPSRIG